MPGYLIPAAQTEYFAAVRRIAFKKFRAHRLVYTQTCHSPPYFYSYSVVSNVDGKSKDETSEVLKPMGRN